MPKKNKTTTLIVVFSVVALLIGGGIYAFFKLGQAGGVEDTEATSEDGSASLTATFYDLSGQEQTGGVLQSLVGGTNRRTHVSFQLRSSNTGDVVLSNVLPASPNANMDGAFNNVPALATLIVGASNVIVGSTASSCTATAQCNTNEQCRDILPPGNPPGDGTLDTCLIALDPYNSANAGVPNNVPFSISLSGNFTNAQGTVSSVTSAPVTLTYDLRGESCAEDGTAINTCSTTQPNYCRFVEGTAPSIIPNATFCGCPTGYHQGSGTGGEPNRDLCYADTCADGTQANQPSLTTSGTYTVFRPGGSGSYAISGCVGCGDSGGYVTALNNTRVYCNATLSLITACNLARTNLGGGTFTNDRACGQDALSRDAVGCFPTSPTEPSVCQFAPVNPGLSGTIGEG